MNTKHHVIKHFSVPLTKKYTAYSSIVLSPDLYQRFAVLIVKAINHQDNSEHGLYEVIRFCSQSLNKDLSFKDNFVVNKLNSLLDEYKNYFNSKKFTDDEIEKHIHEVQERIQLAHEKLIEDSKREFKEIFSSSYLVNTPTEQILKDLDIK